jgi:peptidoglycan hydrolase-like protein with peptidoglycan-binding domain
MQGLRLLPAVAAVSLAALSGGAATAQAVVTTPSPPPAPAPAPAPVPAPVPSPPPPALSPGKITLTVQHAYGNPPFVIVGGRFVVRGVVVPYVAGQSVKVTFYRDGRKLEAKTVSVLPVGNGAGQFHLGYSSASAGLVQARAAHYATDQQAAFSGRSKSVSFVSADLGSGSRGPSVRLLQSELNGLHYVVPLDGVFDEATGRAVIAYRKVTGLERVASTNKHVFELLQRGAGTFHVHYPQDGRHVEGDLTKQVLAEIEPGGRVRAIYTMSSGKPSTPTVIGHFDVYSKTPGSNSEGMVDSNYFIRGYAIHGYHEVPTYAASHGCLRVPIPDAPAIYGWVRLGTSVDVYNESGGGSKHLSGHAGP